MEKRPEFAAFDPLSVQFKVGLVIEKFRTANDKDKFHQAIDYWLRVEPEIVKLERSQSGCLSGDGEFGVFMDGIDDLTGQPVMAVLAGIKLMIDLAHPDDRVVMKDAERAKDKLQDLLTDSVKDKAKERFVAEYYKEVRPVIKDGLVKLGRATTGRGRKYWSKMLDTSISFAGPVAMGAKLAFTPSEIAGEYCGSVKSVEAARADALKRVYGPAVTLPIGIYLEKTPGR